MIFLRHLLFPNLDDNILEDDALCDDFDDKSFKFDTRIYKSGNLDAYYHHSRSKSDAGNYYH